MPRPSEMPLPTPRVLRVLLLLLLVAAPPLLAREWIQREGLRITVDPVEDELAAGRPRQAALLLEERLRGQGDTAPEELVRLARAHAGWGNHARARSLLEGRPWLDDVDGGAGWRVLAGALEAAGEWGRAAAAWEEALPHAPRGEVPVLALRRVGALIRNGDGPRALPALDALPPAAGPVREWVALELMRTAAAAGDTATLRGTSPYLSGPGTRARGLFLPAEGRLAAGDTAGAVLLFQALGDDPGLPSSRRADALSRAGELVLLAGDTAAAVPPLRRALELAEEGSGAYRGARILLDLEALRPSEWIRAAGALEAGVDPWRAARAWEVILAGGAGVDPSPGEVPRYRLRLARLLLRIDREEEARRLLEELVEGRSEAVVVPALELLVGVETSRGREERVRVLEERLVERYPESGPALSVVFFRADAAHDRDQVDRALELYRQAAGMSPARDLAGLARMRWGQLLLRQGDPRGAAEVFEGYLQRFPSGRRWSEAAYWAARSREALGETEAARRHRERIAEDDPLGYYAVRMGIVGGVGNPGTAAPPGEAAGGSAEGGGGTPPLGFSAPAGPLQLLVQGGFQEGADAVRGDMEAGAAGDPARLLEVAEALHAAGLHLEAVNVGYDARRAGAPWDLRLARVIYPFPHREMILREARDRGVDPWLVAAIIRQESAFTPGIESGAGAVGFMQVLPRTGADLATRERVSPWTPALLRVPEVNVHLGTAYLAELMERHGPELALVLSAYNAGPTRAARWRELPEVNDQERFIERIPFGETRDYVKNVLRNAALYQWLYAGG